MPLSRRRRRAEPAPVRRHRPSSHLLTGAAVALSVLIAAACGTSGRTLRDAEPGATAPPRKTTSTTAPTAIANVPAVLTITTTAWAPGAAIPARYTCDGDDTSPPLVMAGAPEGTAELVLEVRDPDAGGLLHWAVAGISPLPVSFPEGAVPDGAVVVPGARGDAAWFGPCPPAGETHTYDFTVHALPAPSGLDASASEDQIAEAVATATSTAVLTGTYARSG